MLDQQQRGLFSRDGFIVLPGFLSRQDLAPALAEHEAVMPPSDAFHDSAASEYARFRDEFSGITRFPFPSCELCLLAVHDKLQDLAADVLGTSDLRAYSLEAWGKYTGAADYDQSLHRDYLGHSLLVPAEQLDPVQIEMFVYLTDVTAEHGATGYCPLPVTAGTPALPNWYPRADDTEQQTYDPGWHSNEGRPEWYEQEVVATGPAGTVVLYRNETFHRGRSMTIPRGSRFTLHVNFRRADADWITRMAWTANADDPALLRHWNDFVCRAAPRQLQLFGFPEPGHSFWTRETLRRMAERYPGFDGSAWLRK